jgi:hypothetical protein
LNEVASMPSPFQLNLMEYKLFLCNKYLNMYYEQALNNVGKCSNLVLIVVSLLMNAFAWVLRNRSSFKLRIWQLHQ